MTEIFKIRENGFEEIKKKLIIRAVPTLLIGISFGIAIVFFNSKDKEDLYSILPFTIPFLLFFGGFGVFRGLKRQKMLFESYQLIFSESDVTREQANTPTVNIQFINIKSITKDAKGGYIVKGKTTAETIFIPAQIENYENLEILLNQIKPFSESNELSFDEKYKIPIMILTLVCIATVYISVNKILVGICGIIASFVLIRSFILIKKNKSIDNKTKRIGYYLLLGVISIVAVTIMKLTSDFDI